MMMNNIMIYGSEAPEAGLHILTLTPDSTILPKHLSPTYTVHMQQSGESEYSTRVLQHHMNQIFMITSYLLLL